MVRFLIYCSTIIVAVSCGDAKLFDFESCKDIPPSKEIYGPADEAIKEPDNPPHETISYRWNCLPANIVIEESETSPNSAEFLFVEETWRLQPSGCWFSEESRTPDSRCSAKVCQDVPPERYGPANNVIQEPADAPETITYSWDCVTSTVDQTNELEYLAIEETWSLETDGCWLPEVTRTPISECVVSTTTSP